MTDKPETTAKPDGDQKNDGKAEPEASKPKARFVLPRALVFLAAIGAVAFLVWRYEDYAVASVAGWLAVTMLPMRAVFRVGLVFVFLVVVGSFAAVVAVEDDTDYLLGTKDTLVIPDGPATRGMSVSLKAEGSEVTENRLLPGLVVRHTTGPWVLRLHLLDHSRSAETATVVSAKMVVDGTDVWLYQPGGGADSDAVAVDPTRQAAFARPTVGDRVIEQAAPSADALLGRFTMPDGATSLTLIVELTITGGQHDSQPHPYEFTVTPATVGDSGFLVKKPADG